MFSSFDRVPMQREPTDVEMQDAGKDPSYTYVNILVYNVGDKKSSMDVSTEAKLREGFLSALEEKGIICIKYKGPKFGSKNGTTYLKLFARRKILANRAEKLGISVPFKKVDEHMHDYIPHDNTEDQRSTCETLYHLFSPLLRSGFFKIPFNEDYDDILKSNPTGDPLKNTRILGMIIDDIVREVEMSELVKRLCTSELNSENDFYGIDWMIKKEVFTDYFLLHNKKDRDRAETELNKSRFTMPITPLMNYLGEKIAFAFAWRSAWLSNALGLPMILGK